MRLEADLKQLEAEYNMFFSGRLPKPPWETRARVEALVKRFDRGYIQNTGDRFRFNTLQSRYAAFIDLWDRGQRAREEGRPGPFAQKPRAAVPQVCGPGEESGEETAAGRLARGRVSCGGQGREGELYGESTEGRRGVMADG